MSTEQLSADPHGAKPPAARKRFVPLENNPEVMTSLIHKLGLSPTLSFHDVFSIDEPDLLAIVPRPAHALLLIFPVSSVYEAHRAAEDGPKGEYEGAGEGEPVVWFRQTIGNACGLIGLLHAVCNGGARGEIVPGSDLDNLLAEAIPLNPTNRAELLYNSPALEAAHADAAAGGDTSAPAADERVDLHFVTFVKGADGAMWELDGRRKGPLQRGVLDADEDVLSERALGMGVRRFIEREGEAGGDLRFSLIVLGPSMD
ncbi:cysteine proteinase [Trichodelitschia bisporula]|uniref:Ubiquitin carboxyl-terminal hydrolase n=1 Tax=Trichodelitschia bisporula TaxID=703511 RepID=A0A6G1HL65_9PEZI|nr:cysteine proteinase [Trichodelitschia bisporula]